MKAQTERKQNAKGSSVEDDDNNTNNTKLSLPKTKQKTKWIAAQRAATLQELHLRGSASEICLI